MYKKKDLLKEVLDYWGMVLRNHHIEVRMQLMVDQILGEEMGLLVLDTFLGNECPVAGQIFYQTISKREG